MLALAVTLTVSGCSGNGDGVSERLPGFGLPGNDPSFRSRVYGGAGVGSSSLDPDTSETVFTVENDSDSATRLRIGADIHNLVALEAESAVLGAAQLREADTDVSFSAISLNALVYGLNGVQMRSRRQGFSAYGRLGFAKISKSSRVLTLGQGDTSPVLGLGVEYGFANGIGIRGELTRYSDEAQVFGLDAVYRFGRSPGDIGRLIADAAQPDAEDETRVAEGPPEVVTADRFGNEAGDERAYVAGTAVRIAEPAATTQVVVAGVPVAGDRDGDGVGDTSDKCVDTAPGIAVNKFGCGLFDAVLGDVTFKPGSVRLNARARGALDLLATKLEAFSEVRVEVRAHTDSQGAADANLALSARRAEAVVNYLRGQGVAELQLDARGVGEAQPVASNGTASGRKSNRRIELVTLASADQNVPDGSQARGTVWNYPVVREAQNVLREVEDGTLVVKPGTPQPASASRSGQGVVATPEGEPAMGAALAEPAGTAQPPIPGLRPTALPAPGFVSGFDMSGVVEGLGFVAGSDQMTDTGPAAVERIREAMQQYPAAHIAVMAHTDNTGDAQLNQALSEQRARRVVELLIDSGIEASRLKPEGYGETLPLVQNLTESDRARNRRIEVRVVQ